MSRLLENTCYWNGERKGHTTVEYIVAGASMGVGWLSGFGVPVHQGAILQIGLNNVFVRRGICVNRRYWRKGRQ